MKKAAKFRKEFRCFFSFTDIGEVSDAIHEFFTDIGEISIYLTLAQKCLLAATLLINKENHDQPQNEER